MQSHCVFACSGPGAGLAIGNAIQYGYVSAAIAISLTLATTLLYVIIRCNFRAAILNVSPMVLHPAWTISAIGGDCGITKVFASNLWTMLAIAQLLIAVAICLHQGRATNTAGLQFSLKSLLLAMFATAIAVALLPTRFAIFLPRIAFATLLWIALKPNPLPFLMYQWKCHRLATQRLRDRLHKYRGAKAVHEHVAVDGQRHRSK